MPPHFFPFKYFNRHAALLFFLSAGLVPRRGYFIANDEYRLADFVYECGPFLLCAVFIVFYIMYLVKLTVLRQNYGTGQSPNFKNFMGYFDFLAHLKLFPEFRIEIFDFCPQFKKWNFKAQKVIDPEIERKLGNGPWSESFLKAFCCILFCSECTPAVIARQELHYSTSTTITDEPTEIDPFVV